MCVYGIFIFTTTFNVPFEWRRELYNDFIRNTQTYTHTESRQNAQANEQAGDPAVHVDHERKRAIEFGFLQMILVNKCKCSMRLIPKKSEAMQ